MLCFKIIAIVISKAHMVFNPIEWIDDIGDSRHICSNQSLFQEYQEVANGERIFMGNYSIIKTLGKGKIRLKLTYEKIVFE